VLGAAGPLGGLCALAAIHGRFAVGLAAAVRMLAVIAVGLIVSRMLGMRSMVGMRCSRTGLRLMLPMTLVCMGLGRGLSSDGNSERERDRCNEHRLHVISPD
jgi:hypothetical protein